MNKEFVPYEQALELKELGFDEPCGSIYDKDGNLQRSLLEYPIINSKNGFHERWNIITAPLYQQAFRWFREKYGLYYFEDHRCNSKTDISSITYWMGIKKLKLAPFGSEVLVGIIELGCYNTYEEAELACLRKLIEIVKQGGNK